MINQQLKLLIEYRLSESEETLTEASILLKRSRDRCELLIFSFNWYQGFQIKQSNTYIYNENS